MFQNLFHNRWLGPVPHLVQEQVALGLGLKLGRRVGPVEDQRHGPKIDLGEIVVGSTELIQERGYRGRVIIGTALLVGCSPADTKIISGGQPSKRAPDPAIIAKLQEIVELRQQLLKGHQAMVQVGKAEDDGAAEIALAEARLQLARERGQADLVIAELRNLVATQERRLKTAQKKVEVGAAGPDEVARVRVVLLEAQVRLQCEEQVAKGK